MPDCIQPKQFYDRSGEAVANSNAMPCLHTQAAVTPQLRGRLPKCYWEIFHLSPSPAVGCSQALCCVSNICRVEGLLHAIFQLVIKSTRKRNTF